MSNLDFNEYYDAIADLATHAVHPEQLTRFPQKLCDIFEVSTGRPASEIEDIQFIKNCHAHLNFHEKDTNEYRIARNALAIRYVSYFVNAISLYVKQKAEDDFDSRITNKFLETVRKIPPAIKHELSAIKFSDAYYDLEDTIRTSLHKRLKTASKISELYNWAVLSIEERKNLIEQIGEEIISTVKELGDGFENISMPDVKYLSLKEGNLGLYGPTKRYGSDNDVVVLEMDMFAEGTPYNAIQVYIHELGHHIDEFIKGEKPKGFEHDADTLKGLSLFKKIEQTIGRPVFDTFVYRHTPEEKHDFDAKVAGPLLQDLKKRDERDWDYYKVGLFLSHAARILAPL